MERGLLAVRIAEPYDQHSSKGVVFWAITLFNKTSNIKLLR